MAKKATLLDEVREQMEAVEAISDLLPWQAKLAGLRDLLPEAPAEAPQAKGAKGVVLQVKASTAETEPPQAPQTEAELPQPPQADLDREVEAFLARAAQEAERADKVRAELAAARQELTAAEQEARRLRAQLLEVRTRLLQLQEPGLVGKGRALAQALEARLGEAVQRSAAARRRVRALARHPCLQVDAPEPAEVQAAWDALQEGCRRARRALRAGRADAAASALEEAVAGRMRLLPHLPDGLVRQAHGLYLEAVRRTVGKDAPHQVAFVGRGGLVVVLPEGRDTLRVVRSLGAPLRPGQTVPRRQLSRRLRAL